MSAPACTEHGAAAARPQSARRRALIARAHMAAQALGLDEDTRRMVQAAHTGCASCREMTEAALVRLLWAYRELGAAVAVPLPDIARAAAGPDRPSDWQWLTLEREAVASGFDGLEDARLLAFVRRTAGVDHLRFLDRRRASEVISGLMRWRRQRARRGADDAAQGGHHG